MPSKLSRLAAAIAILAAPSAWADDPFFFSNGNVDGRMAVASRPETASAFEIEAADDFLTGATTTITSASFVGLLPSGVAPPTVAQVVVEIYRIFPLDSDVARTSGAPTFSTSRVPTRVNSPSDDAFASRDSAVAGDLTFTTGVVASTFTAGNSVQPGGIHPTPGQSTGGNGQLTGQEVQFNVSFANALVLPAGHYFFVPQVQLSSGAFYWLSSTRPIVSPGTPFMPDLQSWTRDAALDPDWLRVGTDIVGGATPPTFNQAFTLSGTVAAVPEPETWSLMLAGIAAGLAAARRTRQKGRHTHRG